MVEAIFGADVLLAERAINKWAKDNGIILSQEQFDALIMMRHIKGTLGNICDLIERGAPRSEWEKADLRIGASDRRTKQLDLYFNGIYY